MEGIQTTIEFIQGAGFVGLLIILAVPSLKKTIFNGHLEDKTLKEIRDNHLHDITSKLEKIIEQNTEMLIIIKEILRDSKK